MSMTASIREMEGITVMDLSGKITLGEGSGVLREKVKQAVAGGSKKLVINLKDISYIDSAGLGELVAAYTAVKNAGGELKLTNLTSKVKDLLVITKLLTVFDVKDSEQEALTSFS